MQVRAPQPGGVFIAGIFGDVEYVRCREEIVRSGFRQVENGFRARAISNQEMGASLLRRQRSIKRAAFDRRLEEGFRHRRTNPFFGG